MSETFFSSDNHHSHGRIMCHCARPFLNAEEEEMRIAGVNFQVSQASIDLMDETIVDNFNAVVAPNDTLWLLGDYVVTRQMTPQMIKDQRAKLNCRNVHVILGNHDNEQMMRQANCFNSIDELRNIKINGVRLTLCHYAMRAWKSSCFGKNEGSCQLHGHFHWSRQQWMDSDIRYRSLDVGVDGNNFMPYRLDEIVSLLAERWNRAHPE